jgi:hypothetical protein
MYSISFTQSRAKTKITLEFRRRKKKREHTAARQLPHSLRPQTSENKRIRSQKLRRRKNRETRFTLTENKGTREQLLRRRRRKEEMYPISFTHSHSLSRWKENTPTTPLVGT